MKTIKEIMKDNKLKEKEEIKYPINEFDKNNNSIHYKNSDGSEYWQEFDKKGKLKDELVHYSKGKWELNSKILVKG